MNKPKLETITPDVAREMLKCNTHNLPVRESHVDYLASEMSGGRWETTHQGIAFDGDVLVDGQHRLLAVIQSGVTVQMWVFGDVPLKVQTLVDHGRTRSMADEFSRFENLENAKQIIPASRSIVMMCCYFQSLKVSGGVCKIVIEEFGRDFAFVVAATKNFRPANRSWIVAALTIAANADRACLPFIESFGSGENIKHGDPAKTLRDWITNGSPTIISQYKRGAIESVFNSAFNAVHNQKVFKIKRGSNGMDYFLAKKRKFVSTIREAVKQQFRVAANN